MSDINLKPVFDYLDEMKAEMQSEFKNVKEDIRVLQVSVDNLTKMVKDFRDEHIVLHRRLEVLEKWAKEVSDKVGIPLPH